MLEWRAAHGLAIHEEADEFAHVAVFAIHGPRNDGFVAFGFEGEINRARACQRFDPVHALADEFARFAFGNRCRTSTGLVSFPTSHRANAGIRATVSGLRVWVHFGPGIPFLELLVVVDLVEERICRSSNGQAAFHPEIGGLEGGNDEDNGNDGDDAEEDFFDHDGVWFGRCLMRELFRRTSHVDEFPLMAIRVGETMLIHESMVDRFSIHRSAMSRSLGYKRVERLAGFAGKAEENLGRLMRVANFPWGELTKFRVREDHDVDVLADHNAGSRFIRPLRLVGIAQPLVESHRARQISHGEIDENLGAHEFRMGCSQ